LLGYGVILLSRSDKSKNEEQKGKYLQNIGAIEGSDKTFFKKMPIYWAAENFFAFQILQSVRVI
jgi:hypothetical protein